MGQPRALEYTAPALRTNLLDALQADALGAPDAPPSPPAAAPSTAAPPAPTRSGPEPFRFATAQRSASSGEAQRHLVLQFDGAAEWCDGIAAASAAERARMSADDALIAVEATGAAAAEAGMGAEAGASDDDCFREGEFGQEAVMGAVSDAEDALLMVEAWLNFHFDRDSKERTAGA